MDLFMGQVYSYSLLPRNISEVIWELHFNEKITSAEFNRDGRHLLVSAGRAAILLDSVTGKEIRRFAHNSNVTSVAISPDGRYILTGSEGGVARYWNYSDGREICRLISFRDGTWAVVDAEGRYDASNAGDVEGLHWVAGTEPLALSQLKERYYEPGLLSKILSTEPLRSVSAFKYVKLFPEARFEPTASGSTKLILNLKNRGGGIGKVRVLVNGKEIIADARGPKPDPQAKQAKLSVDLTGAPIVPGKENRIQVIAWNAEGYLSSRGAELVYVAPEEKDDPSRHPNLYAIIAGVSDYAAPQMNLKFAAKDAEDMAKALELGANNLFSKDKTHIVLLTTTGKKGAPLPTKDNLRAAFEQAAERAKPWDIFVVYLAGHGIALPGAHDLYLYPTMEARTLNSQALADIKLREATTVSSDELIEWIKQVKALKQVMILDTCAAGAATSKLIEKRDVSSDQIRAIERLKDRTGFHVLMGSAADAVSYEASQYGQGLLTYSLLQGIKGAALREDQYVDVSVLFQYAADQVPDLARNIGGIQRPIIAAPKGASFDVGLLKTKEDKAAIPLARVKPLVLRPLLINAEQGFDDLELMPALRQRLQEESYAAARGRGGVPIGVYVNADEMPGAVRPSGTYVVAGDQVKVTLNLIRDGKKVTSFQIEGSRQDLTTLVRNIVERLADTLKG